MAKVIFPEFGGMDEPIVITEPEPTFLFEIMDSDTGQTYGPYWLTIRETVIIGKKDDMRYIVSTHVCDDPSDNVAFGFCGHMEYANLPKNPF